MTNSPETASKAFYAWLDEHLQLGHDIRELANQPPATIPNTWALCRLAEWHNRLVSSRDQGEWLSDHAADDGKDTGWEQHEFGNAIEMDEPIRDVWLVCPSRMLVDPDLCDHVDPRWRDLECSYQEYANWVGMRDQRRARLIQLKQRFGSTPDICPWLLRWDVRKLKNARLLTGRL